MRGDKMVDNIDFDAQLDKTEEVFISYNEELVKLKEVFYNKYDRSIIIGLLHLIQRTGHPTDQKQAEEFEKGYNSDNVDVVSLRWFKKAYIRYNEAFMNKLNGKEDVL